MASCSAEATPTPEAIPTPAAEPTVIPSASAPPFIILAYEADGIVADIIRYRQLTHLNYCFPAPKPDGTFNPINTGWKLNQIVGADIDWEYPDAGQSS
jgi:hypothetical protein